MAQQSTVLEFTCLWTLNKTQKRKNWRDGTIRFHQFNKRAMVYDDHRRLIDDFFLPHTEISSGDELEFERILVTVEDALGTVTQDLTPLYQRKNNNRASSNHTAPPLIAEPQSSPRQPPRTGRQVTLTDDQTQKRLIPGFNMSSKFSSTTVSSAQSAEPSRSVTSRTPPHRQTIHGVPSLASKPFVPHRVREVLHPPPPLQHVNLEYPNSREDSRLPTQHPATVTDPPIQRRNSRKAKQINLTLLNEAAQTKYVIEHDGEILDAWTPQEAEDLFGVWRPPQVLARMR